MPVDMTTAVLVALALLQVDPAGASPASTVPAIPSAPAASDPAPAPAASDPAPTSATVEAPPAAEPAASPAVAVPVAAPPAAPAEAPAATPAAPTPASAVVETPAATAETQPPAADAGVAAPAPAAPPPGETPSVAPAEVAAPASVAPAAEPTAPAEPSPATVPVEELAVEADVPEEDEDDEDALPRWGLTIDGGFPDFAGLAVLYRPWYWLRLEAGGTTTVYASHGYRAGVSLVPFHFPITPVLTFNYGRALEADWNPMLERFAEPDPDLEPVLRKFGYQYVDAHLGLEIGAPRRFVFFVRAGLTQMWTTVHGLTAASATALEDADATVADTKITLRIPSVKVGFLIYLF